MRLVAFAGPSLTKEDRGGFRGVEWLPPAEAGDLLQIAPESGLIVCLIDGYFDHRPAVRHKEILLRLSEGVRILGGASIGALRAAEMDRFGMIGVGAIYRAYRRGSIEGDDEVALIHATEEHDWRPLSVPMVDVRAALCGAVRARMIGDAEARLLLRAAQAIHYADRSWTAIAERAPASASAIRWLREHAQSQKRLDALACLKAALEPPSPEVSRPEAVKTAFLEALARECGVPLPAQR